MTLNSDAAPEALSSLAASDAPETSTPDLLLAAAGALMLERESIDVSLHEIARRSGMNASLVKYYFGSKSGMLLEMVRRAVGKSLKDLQEIVTLDIAPEAKLRAHIRGVVNSHHRHPYLHRLLHHMLSQEDAVLAAALSQELITPVIEAQAKILEEGVAAGVFHPVDPVMFYFHLLGACESLFYSRSLLLRAFKVDGVSAAFKRDYVDYLSAAVLDGIVLRSRTSESASTPAGR